MGSDMAAESEWLIYLLLCKSFNTLCFVAGGASSHFEMYVTVSDMAAESKWLIYLLLCKSFNTHC